jgi:hypothetical protein
MAVYEERAEKRAAKRLNQRLFIRFGLNNRNHIGVVFDLSSVGLFVRSSTVFSLRTQLDIELKLPDNRSIVCIGEIVWVKRIFPDTDHVNEKQGMGIHLPYPPESYERFVEDLHSF